MISVQAACKLSACTSRRGGAAGKKAWSWPSLVSPAGRNARTYSCAQPDGPADVSVGPGVVSEALAPPARPRASTPPPAPASTNAHRTSGASRQAVGGAQARRTVLEGGAIPEGPAATTFFFSGSHRIS